MSKAIKDKDGVGDFWSTPFPIWGEIQRRYIPGTFAQSPVFDPAPNLTRLLPGTFALTNDHGAAENGLEIIWPDVPFFLNPPWSDITPWARKAARSGRDGVMLIPNRTDQAWMQAYAPGALKVDIGGRVNYINPATGTTDIIDKDTGKIRKGSISCGSSLLVFSKDAKPTGKYGVVEYWTPDCHATTKKKVEDLIKC